MTAARPGIARTALALGVIGSLASNVAWAWPRPVLVGVGVLMALVLPTAVTLWRASGTVTGWARIERAAVMSFIAFGAGTYTAVHASLLLHDNGLPWLIAWLPALVGEALVVMAARAAAPQTRPVSRPAGTPRTTDRPRRDTATVTAPTAVPATAPDDETPLERTRRLARGRKAAQRARRKENVTA